MPVGVRRSEFEIIYDILKMGGGKPTTIRHSANLSHAQLQKYLGFLEKSNLILPEQQNPRATYFSVSDNGKLTLELIERLLELLGPADC
jgi:predicted transcriptional regulator